LGRRPAAYGGQRKIALGGLSGEWKKVSGAGSRNRGVSRRATGSTKKVQDGWRVAAFKGPGGADFTKGQR